MHLFAKISGIFGERDLEMRERERERRYAVALLITIRSVSRHCHEFTTFLFESLSQLKTEKGKQVSTWCRQVYERVLDPHRLEHLCDLYPNAGGDLKRQIALFANFV